MKDNNNTKKSGMAARVLAGILAFILIAGSVFTLIMCLQ